MAAFVAACGGESNQTVDCGDGGLLYDTDVGAVCAYANVSAGFECPSEVEFRLNVQGTAVVCSESLVTLAQLPTDVCRELGIENNCNTDNGVGGSGGSGGAGGNGGSASFNANAVVQCVARSIHPFFGDGFFVPEAMMADDPSLNPCQYIDIHARGSILRVGGLSEDMPQGSMQDAVSKTMRYDPINNTWTLDDPVPSIARFFYDSDATSEADDGWSFQNGRTVETGSVAALHGAELESGDSRARYGSKDLLVWDPSEDAGSRWSVITLPLGQRTASALAYDETSDRVILWGGSKFSGLQDDEGTVETGYSDGVLIDVANGSTSMIEAAPEGLPAGHPSFAWDPEARRLYVATSAGEILVAAYLDMESNDWTVLPATPTGFAEPFWQGAVLDGRWTMTGTIAGQGTVAVTYAPTTQQWTVAGPEIDVGAAVKDGQWLYVPGDAESTLYSSTGASAYVSPAQEYACPRGARPRPNARSAGLWTEYGAWANGHLVAEPFDDHPQRICPTGWQFIDLYDGICVRFDTTESCPASFPNAYSLKARDDMEQDVLLCGKDPITDRAEGDVEFGPHPYFESAIWRHAQCAR